MSSERPREPVFPDERTAIYRPSLGLIRHRSFWRWLFDLLRGRA